MLMQNKIQKKTEKQPNNNHFKTLALEIDRYHFLKLIPILSKFLPIFDQLLIHD